MQALLNRSQNISVLPALFCHKSKTPHCSRCYEENSLPAKTNTLSELGHADSCYNCKGGLNCRFFCKIFYFPTAATGSSLHVFFSILYVNLCIPTNDKSTSFYFINYFLMIFGEISLQVLHTYPEFGQMLLHNSSMCLQFLM